MLVLTRKTNEKIVFPAIQASVQIVGIQGGRVRLGIEAPENVVILREEVAQRDPAQAASLNRSWMRAIWIMNSMR